MDILDEQLTTESLDQKYLPSIRAVLNMGKKLINKYYSKTDNSDVYRISMSKHGLLNMLLVNLHRLLCYSPPS